MNVSSQDETEKTDCFFDRQVTAPPASVNTYPLVAFMEDFHPL